MNPTSCRVTLSLVLGALLLTGESACAGDLRILQLLRRDGVLLNFMVEFAVAPQERSRGLMHRDTLPPRQGMWFDFGQPSKVSMWMKNTRIPLDMLFIRSDGTVSSIVIAATPHSLQQRRSAEPVRYVLELNGGESERYGIQPGDRFIVPRLD